jgi:hypothetical protein
VWDLLDQSIWSGIGLVVALLVLAWAAYRLRSWYGDDEDRTDAEAQLLMQLRRLRVEGDVSEEEFRSIKGRLTEPGGDPAAPRRE